jgi:hypothetical protein
MIGLEWRAYQMYSGGGASTTRVTLYRITQGSDLRPEVLTVQTSGEVSIRACFNEADTRARRDACLDQYDFAGELSLDGENASGPPRLVLQTAATTYPGPRSRLSDSTQEAPLTEEDLVITPDAECSYRRVLTFNGESYQYDTPPPACEDYQPQ